MKTAYKVGIGLVVLAGGSYVIYKSLSGRYISGKGIKFLTDLEGAKNKAYKDVKGLWTIGVGHLIKPTETKYLTKTLTSNEVKNLFNKDLDVYEKAVKDTIKVPLTPYQKDALTSIAFNIGVNGFKSSSLAKKINAKATPEQIINAFSMWDTPAVLSKRRAKEARLYFTGNYSNVLNNADFSKYYKPVGISECCPVRKIKKVKLNDRVYKLVA